EVHREMVSRFEKAEQVALHIIDEAMAYIKGQLDTMKFKNISEEAEPFFVVNPTGWTKSGLVEFKLEVAKKYFAPDYVQGAIDDANTAQVPAYKIVDENGNELKGEIEALGIHFGYDLPKDKFRQPYMCQELKVIVEVEKLAAFDIKRLALIPVAEKVAEQGSLVKDGHILENDFVSAKIEENGSITITHKATGNVFQEQCIYEDHGDMGNEYIYFMPVGEKSITSKDAKAEVRVVKNLSHVAAIETKVTIHVPKSGNEQLDKEMRELVWFNGRKAQRVTETIPMEITTTYTLERLSRGIKVKTSFNNEALDHRVRALFTTNIDSAFHYADSIFEVAKRDTVPSKEWRNPCNAQHQQAFINVHDEKVGLTVANKGLNEYELLRDGMNTIALTIHRGTRELGDWGVFPTPEAQCLGHQEVEFEIIPHGAGDDVYASYVEAYQFQIPFATMQTVMQEGKVTEYTPIMVPVASDGLMYSSLKLNKATGDVMTRWYSVSDKETALTCEAALYESNLLEENLGVIAGHTRKVAPCQIVTLGFDK
ncbi:MAG: glycoside hydrolase family 38 C-terminal domain-containing protein, partial [Niameybacter sp.]